eukprot:9667326-Ditylum_brightwellii.AAC.1
MCEFAACTIYFIAVYHLLPPPTSGPKEAQAKTPQKLTMAGNNKDWKKYQHHHGIDRSDTKWYITIALVPTKSASNQKQKVEQKLM